MFICYAWMVECWVIEKMCTFLDLSSFLQIKYQKEKIYLGLNFVTGKKFP